MRTIEEILNCVENCVRAVSCDSTTHDCCYGDDGIADCVDRLESDYFEILEGVKKIGTIDRLREICEAERDGRLVVLPCKVGDTVYAIADCADILKDCDDDYYTGTGAITCPFEKDCDFEECDDANRRIFETYVRSIYKDKDEPVNIFLDKIVDRQFYPSDFGKTVFLTREEAEAELAKQKG